MEYIKCDIPTENAQLAARYTALSEAAAKKRRRANRLHTLGTFVFYAVFLIVAVGLLIVGNLFSPDESGVLAVIAKGILWLLWVIFALIVGVFLGAVAAAPFWKPYEKQEKEAQRQLLQDATKELRDFYRFCAPFLVTKCYYAHDRRFDRHDVCLFFVDGKLRITANLHYGFFHPKRDLGCYILPLSEIRLTDTVYKGRTALLLECDKATFCLGIQAKAFLQNPPLR